MAEEILSIAHIRPEEGKDKEALSILRELYALLQRKQYCRDQLFRDAADAGHLVNLRYWKSAEARAAAQEDPDVHRLWIRLSQVAHVDRVTEKLEEIEWWESPAGD